MIAGVEAWAVLGVGAFCALILVLAEAVHRVLAVDAEWTRKLVHVLMGLTAAAFPLFFRSPRSVLVLCAVFAMLLGASRRWSWLRSVHGVDRHTAGAVFFPLGVVAVFVAAEGRSTLYVVSILVLTLADPAAAVVGQAYGAHRFRAGRDAKSLEGSLAFLAVAQGCVLVALRLTTSLGPAASIGWALAIAVALASVEAASPAGSDNFLVPVGALLLLRSLVPHA